MLTWKSATHQVWEPALQGRTAWGSAGTMKYPEIPLPNSAASPLRRRRAPAARSSVSFCARCTKAVRKFRALLPLPALRPGTGRAPSVAALPPAAAPHPRQRQKFSAPRLRCCRCGRDGRAPLVAATPPCVPRVSAVLQQRLRVSPRRILRRWHRGPGHARRREIARGNHSPGRRIPRMSRPAGSRASQSRASGGRGRKR